jgi:bacterioferritin
LKQHSVRTFRSADNLPRAGQLAWKIAEVAVDPVAVRSDVVEMLGNRIIDRILYLDGTPNMQRLNPVRVGEDPIEQHKLDLAMEADAIARYNRAIALCTEKNDGGTREILEDILRGEEDSADWLEAQLHLVNEVGKERYLAEMIHE